MQKLNKPVLTFYEFAELISNSDNKYDLDSDSAFIKVKSILLDFIREGRLRPTFNYAGIYTSEASGYRNNAAQPVHHEKENGNLYIFADSLASLIEQQDSYLQASDKKNVKGQIFRDWLHIPNYMAERIVLRHLADFHNMFKKGALFKRIELHDDKLIGFHDLRYPRIDIDELFGENHKKYYEKQINSLTNQLSQANTELDMLKKKEDMPANDRALSLKDSAYCLIAVLKDLLLDPDINAYNFKTDTNKSTNQPTQAGLAEYIDEMNIKGLKTRNINGIFSQANRLLNDAKKN
ncbi:hypothetical protein ES754_10305 [Psychrobacter frigidicola]|uniref:Uncharacterized protein n=1 Tax=Psychrobacter frigidicola TaxID=45611 RepID=A0A5C7A428_9GAMM|nr:hypothetical protein [Psychrobacter frigidicola]TXD96520.1 hypothetical protein ES754_10305 [Psychrobacter frigidicola]